MSAPTKTRRDLVAIREAFKTFRALVPIGSSRAPVWFDRWAIRRPVMSDDSKS